MELKVDIKTDQSLAHILGQIIEKVSGEIERARHAAEATLNDNAEHSSPPHEVAVRLGMDLRRALGDLDDFTRTARSAATLEAKHGQETSTAVR